MSNSKIFSLNTLVKVGVLYFFIFGVASCDSSSNQPIFDTNKSKSSQFFLLGDDFDSKMTISSIIEKSNLKKGGYVLIIPTSFLTNDKQANKLRQEFNNKFIRPVHILSFKANSNIKNTDVIAIENANVICFVGEKRNQFIKLVNRTRLKEAFYKAKDNGTVIAGIGNGASIMGDYYFYSTKGTNTQAAKTMLKPGLGLLKNTVVGNIDLLTNYKEDIAGSSSKGVFVFIGMENKSSIWIADSSAVVLSSAGVELISPDNEQAIYKIGEKFSLPSQ